MRAGSVPPRVRAHHWDHSSGSISGSDNCDLALSRPLMFVFLLICGLFVSWEVLIAATAIGQLSKPFTSDKDGPGPDLRTVFRSGGMPSTHSAVSKMISHSLTVCFLQFFTILFAQRA
jgi:hypothetical protein